MVSQWRPPLWYDKPVGRIRFFREVADIKGVKSVKNTRNPGGFSVSMVLNPLGVPSREVNIAFSRLAPTTPHVTVDGPTQSPHRYSDGALCMWYPGDPAYHRWVLSDGAGALVANITAHLIREEWYRATGEWLGDEVPHTPKDPENDPDRFEAIA
jgi:hypothetical protein